MIRRWLAARVVLIDHSNQLRAAGLSADDTRVLRAAGLDPLEVHFPLVLAAAQMGTAPHEIPGHVRAAYRVKGVSTLDALHLTGRLYVLGIPYDHAATLVTDIARATQGA